MKWTFRLNKPDDKLEPAGAPTGYRKEGFARPRRVGGVGFGNKIPETPTTPNTKSVSGKGFPETTGTPNSKPVSGKGFPETTSEFVREPLREPETNPELEANLRKLFGHSSFRKGQQAIIESILDGKSTLAIMPTGAGKSLCYQLPALLADPTTLVVSPLIALMKDQVEGLPDTVQHATTLINSSLESDDLEKRVAEIKAGRYKLVYAAPERLRQRPFLHALATCGISLLVVDEAHCLSMWGHDFRPDYLYIGKALDMLGNPTLLAMTATAAPETQREISAYLGRKLEIVNAGTFRPNLRLESRILKNNEEKARELVALCNEMSGSGIVYVSSRERAERLAILLRRHNVRAKYYHAGMEPQERSQTQDEFMDDRYRVIVATVAFGMGVDKADVRFVIHYSLPHSIENYYQEAGRAGRDGKPSRCILLSTSSDKANLTRWMNSERINMENLRDTYRAITRRIPSGGGNIIHDDDLRRDAQIDETKTRVAISLLEKAGMLVRHFDLPVTANIGVRSAGGITDQEFTQFVDKARLRPNQRLAIETLELVERTGIPATEIEGLLLKWRDFGWINYRSSGRAMFLERPPARPGMRELLDDMLRRYESEQLRRVERMAEYAKSKHCRHGMIAAHFGDAPIKRCGQCDVCDPGKTSSAAPAPTGPSVSKAETRAIILQAVATVPYPVGWTGLFRLLKGSIESSITKDKCPYFGALAGETKSEVENAISELLEQGYLERDTGEFRLLSLTAKGRAAIKST
ncbi:MAG: RecQ family ATP-dependent DNA helicase [Armatimonadota bacterium]|nr:RecQ family ATP-dependent DNA helicase [Armatimonadota bacterium]